MVVHVYKPLDSPLQQCKAALEQHSGMQDLSTLAPLKELHLAGAAQHDFSCGIAVTRQWADWVFHAQKAAALQPLPEPNPLSQGRCFFSCRLQGQSYCLGINSSESCAQGSCLDAIVSVKWHCFKRTSSLTAKKLKQPCVSPEIERAMYVF